MPVVAVSDFSGEKPERETTLAGELLLDGEEEELLGGGIGNDLRVEELQITENNKQLPEWVFGRRGSKGI